MTTMWIICSQFLPYCSSLLSSFVRVSTWHAIQQLLSCRFVTGTACLFVPLTLGSEMRVHVLLPPPTVLDSCVGSCNCGKAWFSMCCKSMTILWSEWTILENFVIFLGLHVYILQLIVFKSKGITMIKVVMLKST